MDLTEIENLTPYSLPTSPTPVPPEPSLIPQTSIIVKRVNNVLPLEDFSNLGPTYVALSKGDKMEKETAVRKSVIISKKNEPRQPRCLTRPYLNPCLTHITNDFYFQSNPKRTLNQPLP